MSVIGPLAPGTGLVIQEDLGGNGQFKSVAYGYNEADLERWWLYSPGGSGADDYRSPGFAQPSQVARYRYVAPWDLTTWKGMLAGYHPRGASHAGGHPYSPYIPHDDGASPFAYVKGARVVLDTLPATVAAMEAAYPRPPSPSRCTGGRGPEVDPSFLRIRPLGGGGDLGYVFAQSVSSGSIAEKVELWMLIDDASFPRPSAQAPGFEVVQRRNVTGPGALDQSVIDFFASHWVNGRSSLTIVKTRWYPCWLAPADL